MAAMTAIATSVPLTAAQKMKLSTKFVPVIFFVAALIFTMMALPNIIGQAVPPLLPVFLVVVLLVMIYEASKSLRDLMSGAAVIEEDELVRLWHSRGNNKSVRYGNFARLGKMQISRTAFNQAQVGQQYRLCYSPASRIVWTLEPNAYWSSVIGKNN